MTSFTRTDRSLVSRWWWTVDRWTLAAVVILVLFGAILTLAASPAVAERLGYDTYHFVRRQFVFLVVALAVMMGTAILSQRGLRRLSLFVLAAALFLTALVPVIGLEMNGASRWLRLGPVSLQPSEFIKPTFAVITAWLFARRCLDDCFPGFAIGAALMVAIAGLLLTQPDVGMTTVIAGVWATQLFLAGIPLLLVFGLGAVALAGAVGAYFAFGHVRSRVDVFLDPNAEQGYQVARSLQAFRDGGLLGRGPGEGQVKEVLPDAHADFVFAVAGEEFGLVVCLLIVLLFAFVVLRGFSRVLRDNDLFALLAAAGLLVQFGLQTLVNLASTTNMIPPKGMTLPFISYGGSSALSLALTVGMVLALTRERLGGEERP